MLCGQRYVFKMQGKGMERVWVGGSAIIDWIVRADFS